MSMVAVTDLFDRAKDAFERLFMNEYGRVVSVAFRITRNDAEAQDVAQDVFVRFARSGAIDSERARRWLYRTAVHTALNSVRTRRRRAKREERDFALRRPIEAAAQRMSDPQLVLERQANSAAVREALSRLPMRHAEILALRYGGFTTARSPHY